MTNPLMARFAGEPALVEPGSTERFESCLAQVMAHPQAAKMLSGELMQGEDFWQEDGGWCRPYTVTNGILQIPVKGVLLNNFPYQLYSWATGYEYIWEAFKRGCADYAIGAIKGIALVEDSGGGMVAGCFDAVDKMVALKEQTGVPVRAFAQESAYSAAYAIATVGDHINVSRTGGVGSIGVVTGHLDISGAMDKAGLKFTYIASDPSKVEGNPYSAPSKGFLDRTQARIDELYGIFVSAVARSRGLEESAIRDDLKAYCYTATQATSNGLADSIGSLEDAVSAFAGFLDDQSDNNGDENMADPANTTSAVDQAAAIEDARDEGRTAGHAAGLTEGATAERTRIGAILGHAEAEGREAQALYFATKTSMSVEDATGALAAAPKAEAPKAAEPKGQSFSEAMEGGNPNVGIEAVSPTEDADKGAALATDLKSLCASVGLKGF